MGDSDIQAAVKRARWPTTNVSLKFWVADRILATEELSVIISIHPMIPNALVLQVQIGLGGIRCNPLCTPGTLNSKHQYLHLFGPERSPSNKRTIPSNIHIVQEPDAMVTTPADTICTPQQTILQMTVLHTWPDPSGLIILAHIRLSTSVIPSF
ncbi:hypothetical protein Tco_0817224 [Tanacetum coccineum]